MLGNFFDTINIRQDVIIVKNDNKFGLFNVNDFSLILKCIWDSVSYNSYGIIASKNNHYAFFSCLGQEILECIWDKIKPTVAGLIVLKNNKKGFYSFEGKCIFECKYNRIEAYSSAVIAYEDRKKIIYNISK